MKNNIDPRLERREFIRFCGRSTFLGALALITGSLAFRNRISRDCSGQCKGCPDNLSCDKKDSVTGKEYLWQIDPRKCTQCGRCATHCVLSESAVKCAHSYSMCGYCKLCFGYFQPGANALTEAAENQVCPTGAIKRKFVEDPYFEYSIDESLCIGCAKCVAGCNTFGNGSLHMQVIQDRCLNCNDCAIARACPGDAFVRTPVDKPYMFKHELT